MISPRLSDPNFLTRADIQGDCTLTSQIRDLVNAAFLRSEQTEVGKWGRLRFEQPHELFDMLGRDGVMSVIYDLEGRAVGGGSNAGMVVACAAALPWAGGFTREGQGVEEGYEIKTVCVNGDAKYAKRGLAVQVVAHLEDHLLAQELSGRREGKGGSKNEQSLAHLTLWIQASESLNGVYWRKRGFLEVRRHTAGPGVWGCKKTFEMVVFRKDIPLPGQ
jgi:hypothetical protein